MSDKKEHVESIDGLEIGPEMINLIYCPSDNDHPNLAVTTAMKLLNKDIAKSLCTKFLIGKERIEIYGNLIGMSAKSSLINSLLSDSGIKIADTITLAGDISVKEEIEPLVSVWLHMNSCPSESYFMDFGGNPSAIYWAFAPGSFFRDYDVVRYDVRDSRVKHVRLKTHRVPDGYVEVHYAKGEPQLDVVKDSQGKTLFMRAPMWSTMTKRLQVWKWMNYFGLDTKSSAFNNYISGLAFTMTTYMSPFWEIRKYYKIEIPDKYVEVLRDISSKLASLVANDLILRNNESEFDVKSFIAGFLDPEIRGSIRREVGGTM